MGIFRVQIRAQMPILQVGIIRTMGNIGHSLGVLVVTPVLYMVVGILGDIPTSLYPLTAPWRRMAKHPQLFMPQMSMISQGVQQYQCLAQRRSIIWSQQRTHCCSMGCTSTYTSTILCITGTHQEISQVTPTDNTPRYTTYTLVHTV